MIKENTNTLALRSKFNSYYIVIAFENPEYQIWNFQGMAHLIEHYLIRCIQKKKEVILAGKTDFGYMYILGIDNSLKGIKEILNTAIDILNKEIDYIEFEKAKYEVMEELKRESFVNLKIYQFISEGKIKKLPIGNLEDLRIVDHKIASLYIKNFLKERYKIILLGEDVNLDDFISKKDNTFYKNNSIMTKKSVLKTDLIKNKKYIFTNLFFEKREKVLDFFIYRLVLEKYLKDYFPYIYVKHKIINSNNIILYLFSLKNFSEYELYKRMQEITEEEIKILKVNLLKEREILEFEYLINKLIDYKLFGDLEIIWRISQDGLMDIFTNFNKRKFDKWTSSMLKPGYKIVSYW